MDLIYNTSTWERGFLNRNLKKTVFMTIGTRKIVRIPEWEIRIKRDSYISELREAMLKKMAQKIHWRNKERLN